MINKDFLFSIIVPVYNTEKYIEKSLNSILKAIKDDCEVIIINDGSTDNSEKKINEFLEKLPSKLKNNFVYTKKENKGLADTKNVGLDMAHGKYISVVDSDDCIRDDFYDIARRYIDDYDMIIYDVYVVFEKDKKLNYISRAKQDYKENDMVAILNGAISGSSCNKIIKKELYNGYRFPVGKQYEDTAVTPFIISDAKKIKYVPYPMYYYLQREKSIVATNTYMSAYYKICENISEVLRKDNKDMEKYKYVINEFFADRILDILTQELNENKGKMNDNLQKFSNNNKEVLNYIIDSNMIYTIENHYSERQKKLVVEIIEDLKNNNSKNVVKVLKIRKIINKLRSIRR